MNEFNKFKNNIQTNIASWALPREEIPIHIKWRDPIDFDEILIKIPEDLEFKEVINVEDHEERVNLLIIKKIKEAEDVINYFGIVVVSKSIFKELISIRKIEISFHKNSSIIYEKVLYARIFRPLLKIVDYPREIIIDDDNPQNIPLDLKYVGFGDITIKMKGEIKGHLVTRGKSFLYEIIKRLYASDSLKYDKDKKKITVSSEFLARTTIEIIKMFDDFSEDDDEFMNELKRKLTSGDDVEKTLNEILPDKVEEIVMGMIVDLIDKNPTDNIKLLDSKTSVSTVLKAPVETLKLTITYVDIAGNEYSTKTLSIKLDSTKQTERGIVINLPINIMDWKSEPFLNVKEMKMKNEEI